MKKGTEAAAATVAVLTKSALSVDEEVIEFRADKPFTYYILDDNGNVYFAGRYVKKNNKKSTERCFFMLLILTVSLTSVFFGITESYISSFSYFQKRLQA